MPVTPAPSTDEFTTVAIDAVERFGGLSHGQLNWREAAGRWSVAQCLDHRITTTDVYLVELRAIAAGTRRSRAWERWSPLSGFFGRVLVGHMRADGTRTRTPARFVPPNDIGPDVTGRFARSQEELVVAIESTRNVDWDRTIVTSPFVPVATYSLAAAYRIMLEHQHRHIRQAQRVKDQASFPAGDP